MRRARDINHLAVYSEVYAPRSRRQRAQNRTADRRLARTAFTNEAETFTFIQVEGHIVDRFDVPHDIVEKPLRDWEKLPQISDFEKGLLISHEPPPPDTTRRPHRDLPPP